jgi:hypothetical protein
MPRLYGAPLRSVEITSARDRLIRPANWNFTESSPLPKVASSVNKPSD